MIQGRFFGGAIETPRRVGCLDMAGVNEGGTAYVERNPLTNFRRRRRIPSLANRTPSMAPLVPTRKCGAAGSTPPSQSPSLWPSAPLGRSFCISRYVAFGVAFGALCVSRSCEPRIYHSNSEWWTKMVTSVFFRRSSGRRIETYLRLA